MISVIIRQQKRGVLDSISSQYMRVNNIYVWNVITRQQKGGVLVSISSQYMKVNDIHVRNVTTRQHKRGVLDSISSQYMKVNDIHVHRDGVFTSKYPSLWTATIWLPLLKILVLQHKLLACREPQSNYKWRNY